MVKQLASGTGSFRHCQEVFIRVYLCASWTEYSGVLAGSKTACKAAPYLA